MLAGSLTDEPLLCQQPAWRCPPDGIVLAADRQLRLNGATGLVVSHNAEEGA